jgi:hypothetical protein
MNDRCLNCGKILPHSVDFLHKEEDTEDAWLSHESWLELHLDNDIICSEEINEYMFAFICPSCVSKLKEYLRKDSVIGKAKRRFFNILSFLSQSA